MIKTFLNYRSKTKRRDLTSKVIYVILNVALALSIAISWTLFSSIWLAIGLLVLSKWRVFAVKPRFWWANIQSNAVDFIVGLGYITHLSQVPLPDYISQIVLIMLYIYWLLVVKHRSEKYWVVSQGLVALYIGTSSLFIIGSDWPDFVLLGVLILVCFITQRHILATHDIENVNYYSTLSAMISGEVLWVLSHWVIAYKLPLLRGLYLVQPAVIMILLMVIVELTIDYVISETDSSSSKSKSWLKSLRPVLLPIVLCSVTILILLIFFARPLVGNI